MRLMLIGDASIEQLGVAANSKLGSTPGRPIEHPNTDFPSCLSTFRRENWNSALKTDTTASI
jgi:hypothetical protein